jgi:hypothetical protein
MDVSEKTIRAKYSSMDLHELRSLRANPGITDTARRILDEVLYSKGEAVKSGNTIEQAYSSIRAGLARGIDINAILKQLTLQGVSSEVLNGAMAKLKSDIAESQRSPAKSNLMIGGILLAAGAGASGYTYFIATQQGGRYLILWGLMLVGGLIFLKGLYQYLREV